MMTQDVYYLAYSIPFGFALIILLALITVVFPPLHAEPQAYKLS